MASRRRPRPLLERELVFVTGKGGVGKSTVATALGLAAAAQGKRAIVCEVAGQQRVARAFRPQGLGEGETQLADGLWWLAIDPGATLLEWLGSQLGSQRLVKPFVGRGGLQQLVAAAPGARELATLVKAFELTRENRWNRRAETYDLVILDAPATGHGLGMLRTPDTYGEIAKVGPIGRQAARVAELMREPGSAGYLAVALAEEMPVTETLELQARLAEEVGLALDAFVVNALQPQRFSPDDVATMSRVAANGATERLAAAVDVARVEYERVRGQREQLERLRASAKAPLLSLPRLARTHMDPVALSSLGSRLARQLEAPATTPPPSPGEGNGAHPRHAPVSQA